MQCIDITPKSLQMVSFIGLIAHRFERFLTSSPAISTPKRCSSNRCAIPISYRPSFPPQSGVRRIDAQSQSIIARHFHPKAAFVESMCDSNQLSPVISTPKRRSSNRCAIPISYRPSFPPSDASFIESMSASIFSIPCAIPNS